MASRLDAIETLYSAVGDVDIRDLVAVARAGVEVLDDPWLRSPTEQSRQRLAALRQALRPLLLAEETT